MKVKTDMKRTEARKSLADSDYFGHWPKMFGEMIDKMELLKMEMLLMVKKSKNDVKDKNERLSNSD